MKKKNIFLILLLVLIALLLVSVLFAFIWLQKKISLLDNEPSQPSEEIDYDVTYQNNLGGESIEALLEEADDEVKDQINEANSDFESVETWDNLSVTSEIKQYLIIGSDRRSNNYYGNSDVMILVSINADTQKIHLTSFMRAMYVKIPTGDNGYSGMLNWANSMGGPDLCVATIEQNFKLNIDGYVFVDFESFEYIIDAIGGVEIELTQSEANRINSNCTGTVYAGVSLLNGEQALCHARNRSDNDFNRTRRQRNIIQAVFTQAGTMSISDLNTLANEVLPMIKTNLSDTDIWEQIVKAPEYLSYPIDQLMLPVENQDGKHYTGITYIGGHEMYIVDWETNLSALEKHING